MFVLILVSLSLIHSTSSTGSATSSIGWFNTIFFLLHVDIRLLHIVYYLQCLAERANGPLLNGTIVHMMLLQLYVFDTPISALTMPQADHQLKAVLLPLPLPLQRPY